jgi:tetratricopeptide (TPR) repeat protein
MNKNMLLAAAGGLLIGVLLGYTVGMSRGMEAASAMIRAEGGAPGQAAPGMPPPGMPPMPGADGLPSLDPAAAAAAGQRIDMNQRIVAKDPKNVGAWIALGNDYFDTRQYQRSVDAYGEALKLQPNNPDVLTDQGVMYEQLGDFDRALANFEQARRIAPSHVQSLYNIGVVWRKHKNDSKKAMAAWRQVVKDFPGTPQAVQAAAEIADLEKGGAR